MRLQAVVMVQLLLFCVLHLGLVCYGAGNKAGMRCLENERLILLDLKEGFENKSGRLASWVGNDCCSWQGVHCDKLSGHVISLNLSNSDDDYFYSATTTASLKPSLVGLGHLQSLDLSFNNFSDSSFPHFLGSFQKL
jgi:Leucine rich repeat N-terminal domain